MLAAKWLVAALWAFQFGANQAAEPAANTTAGAPDRKEEIRIASLAIE